MSEHTENEARCDAFRDDLAELALGVLSGRRRSEVLNHVEDCVRCQGELERLSIVADTLLQLSPEVEPPLGFESRLAERLRVAPLVARSPHLRRVAAVAVAAVVMVALGFGLGTVATHSNDSNSVASANLASAPLLAKGKTLGEVMLSSGSPAWVFMTIEGGSGWGKVTCEVTLASGKVEWIGDFRLSDGYGAWGAPLTSSAGEVRTARLVASNGTILASATISA